MSKSDYGSALDFMKSTLAPRTYKTGPPSYYTQTSFSKKLDVSANFLVDDANLSTAPATFYEKIPTTTGIIIWQPNRGAGSLYRFGLVPNNAQISSNDAPAGGLSAQQRGFIPHGSASLLGGHVLLKFNSSLAVPYNGTNTGDLIKIAPDLSQSFSQVRVYSGDLRIQSDTVSIGNTALNGYFSAGAFSDTRDISQVVESGGQPNNAFNPADMVQNSVTSKDGLKEVAATRGIVSLVGSDIQPFYQPPNADETDFQSAGWSTYNLTGTPMAAVPAVGTPHLVLEAWVSPWDITMKNLGHAGVQQINVGAINLNGTLDFALTLDISGRTGVDPTVSTYTLKCKFTHVFATCTSGPEYRLHYSTPFETDSKHYNQGDLENFNAVFTSSARKYQESFVTNHEREKPGGMYLGTFISVAIVLSSGTTVDVVGQTVYTSSLQVRARNVYGAGEIGPARVIRWDGMSNGQQIKIDGVINAQCIPEGAIAPFVQQAAMYSDTAHNLNAMTFLAEMYNGDTPFRRNWTGEGYDNFLRSVFPSLSVDQIMSWQQPKLAGVAAASGLFRHGSGAHAAAQQSLAGVQRHTPRSAGMFGATQQPITRARGMFGAAAKMSKKPSKRKTKRSGSTAPSALSALTRTSLASHNRRMRSASSYGGSRPSSVASKGSKRSKASSRKSKGSKRSYKSGGSYKKKGGKRTKLHHRPPSSKASSVVSKKTSKTYKSARSFASRRRRR